MLLLKLSVLTTLLYSLYHWTMRGNTFFLFNRFSLIGGIVLALVLPFIPIGSFAGGDFPNRECHNYKNEGK